MHYSHDCVNIIGMGLNIHFNELKLNAYRVTHTDKLGKIRKQAGYWKHVHRSRNDWESSTAETSLKDTDELILVGVGR